MKVAILVPFFPPKWVAGTEIATYNIATHLSKRSHNVHVITTLDEGLPKQGMENGFNVHRIFRRKVRFLGVISFWMKILCELKKIEPDIVHVQGIGIAIPALFYKLFARKPFIIWGRGSDIYLPEIFTKRLSGLILKNADAIIALTEDMKKQIKKIYGGDVSVIPNGINLEYLAEVESLDELHIKNKKKAIIFVGTLRQIKGLKYLLQAMKLIKHKHNNVGLMLVGDGEDQRYLEELVKELDLGEYVSFVGKVPNEEVPKYMIDGDVFVLPSLSEGFPNVVLEAMASGLPIVATNVGGLPEIIKDGENGFLVEPKNPEEIAEKTLLILDDNKLREKISVNNKEEVKKYSWENAIDALEKIYLKVV